MSVCPAVHTVWSCLCECVFYCTSVCPTVQVCVLLYIQYYGMHDIMFVGTRTYICIMCFCSL